LHWEDCSLIGLLERIPEAEEIRAVYQEFADSVLRERGIEIRAREEEIERLVTTTPADRLNFSIGSKQKWADYFLQLQFWPYEDENGVRPAETILSTYGRTLSNGDERLLAELRDFRNQLLRVSEIQPPLNLEPEWSLGKV
jgi:hypothetical protein